MSALIPGVNLIASCTEENGEISCSVEETNRIRALLGLKPLKIDSDKSDERGAVENFRRQREQERKELQEDEIRLRLEKAKNKRLENKKIEGVDLGSVKDTDESALLSAADWVNRSRKRELSEKEKAKLAAEKAAAKLQQEEEDMLKNTNSYSATDLRGLSVKHGVSDFEAGHEVILTLADSNILETDERGRTVDINDEIDVLENVNMSDRDRLREREQRAKRARQGMYTAYDDEEFADGMPGKKRSILSQYDEENWTGKQKNGPKLVIGDNGSILDTTSAPRLTETMKIAESLKVEARDMAAYYTTTEYANINFKTRSKKEKKKRKIRTKADDDDEDEKLMSMEIDSGASRGFRDANGSARDSLSELDSSRKALYDSAVKKASDIAASKKEVIISMEDGDDAELALSLARARRLAQQQQQQQSQQSSFYSRDAGAEKALQLMRPVKKEAPITADDFENAVDAEGRRADGTLVFTQTTEFTTRLQARMNEKARSVSELAVREQEKMSLSVNESKSDDEVMDIIHENDSVKGEDSDEDIEHVDLVHDQPVTGRGLAATLALLKGSKDLERREDFVGRAKDKREKAEAAGEDRIKIEYRDSLGRKLTTKEAFRQLSYDFHGYGAGKAKTEKRMKAIELRNKAETTSLTEVGTLKSFTKAQEATGRAHVVIDGGNLGSGNSTAEMAKEMAKKKAKAELQKNKKDSSK